MECWSTTLHPPHSWRKTRIVAFEMPRSCFFQFLSWSSSLKFPFPFLLNHDIGVLTSWRALHTFWPFKAVLSGSFIPAAKILFLRLLTFFFVLLSIVCWFAKCVASLVLPSRFNTTTAWSVFPFLQWFGCVDHGIFHSLLYLGDNVIVISWDIETLLSLWGREEKDFCWYDLIWLIKTFPIENLIRWRGLWGRQRRSRRGRSRRARARQSHSQERRLPNIWRRLWVGKLSWSPSQEEDWDQDRDQNHDEDWD